MTGADIWPIVKSRLGLSDDTHKDLIGTYIDEIGHRIKHYCNISAIPEGLKFTWASMAMDAVRVELPNVDEIADTAGGESSVKIGDTQVSGGSGSGGEVSNTSKSVIDSVVLNYRVDLNRYRKLRW
ncbi:phage head-tail connector protein [Paenibacillus thiaminolyticus]|uniref:phage head-tail connector protein n=1 Tax=Paenibacillus thiaminolyticus TaxID=49283 RepID=UPI001162187C|nr:phage head-tail connector protein [Paenibacillus thiaminolyticus]NGP59990.1 phage head-tail connector protein [Paenibacillus thiaminolyticus]NGP60063.1 phage head-tail connector protein [Paenibacillus thiaminolyticus]NGP60106.1 phage head-tail connector protein [Paenibacillus thiaminolyticus]